MSYVQIGTSSLQHRLTKQKKRFSFLGKKENPFSPFLARGNFGCKIRGVIIIMTQKEGGDNELGG